MTCSTAICRIITFLHCFSVCVFLSSIWCHVGKAADFGDHVRRDCGIAVLPDYSFSGIAMTETASRTFSGPPFGGQTPAEKALLRSDARCARLSKPQI